MTWILDHPTVLFGVLVVSLWLAAQVGAGAVHWLAGNMDTGTREDLNLVLGATLTLLGLLIGFSFSMATARYDQRMSLEEAEANAIGTAYVRVDLLGTDDGARLKELLRSYTRLRVQEYTTRDPGSLAAIEARAAAAQGTLWSVARDSALRSPTPLAALSVASINDVLNAQGNAQAAWWNRIPLAAWALLVAVSAIACGLVGYASHAGGRLRPMLLLLPVVVSTALFLIADIDSPRGGVIRVAPRNLEALLSSLG